MTDGARPNRTRRMAATGLVLLAAAACGGGTAAPPEPGTVRGAAPDLRGRRVVVLPFQQVLGVPGDPDAELAFGLRERGRDVRWVLPAEIDEALARTPNVNARTRGLPVAYFLAAEVNRVGDPLYGEFRRIAALTDGDAVLLPVRAALEPAEGGLAAVTLTLALIEPRTGRVLWFGYLEGDAYPSGDPRALASAVEEVARRLLWYLG